MTPEGDNTMIRTQVSLDPELYERARALARQQGISFAELCRRSLAIALARVPGNQPWMAYVGVVEGRPDDSCTVDEVLYGRESP